MKTYFLLYLYAIKEYDWTGNAFQKEKLIDRDRAFLNENSLD